MIRILFLVALGWALSLGVHAQGGTLAKIMRDKTVVIGYVEGAAPFSSVEGSGPPQGYSVDICRSVVESLSKHLKTPLKTRWVALSTRERQEAVKAKRVDLECGTTTWTLSRQAEVDFSMIIFVDGANIVSRSEGGAGRIADFAGKRIAVLPSTTTEKVLRDALAKESVKAEVVSVPSRAEGMKLLESSRVDGFASDRTTLIGAVAPRPDRNKFKLMDADLSIESYALMLPRDDQDFRVEVNRAIAALYRSGDIRKIYDKWLGSLGAPSLLLNATYFIQGISE